jgi:hypothetical protein
MAYVRKPLPNQNPGQFVAKLYVKDRLSYRQIQARYIVGHKTITRLLREQGVQIRPSHPLPIPATKEMVEAFAELGYVDACAKRFDMTSWRMASRLRAAGVEVCGYTKEPRRSTQVTTPGSDGT